MGRQPVRPRNAQARPTGWQATMKLGVHASIAGGLHNAPAEGREQYDCESLQIFTKNQRRWAAPELTDEDVTAFQEACHEHGFDTKEIFVHASYLINIASPEDDQFEKSVDALVIELERASRLGLLGVCVHPGSHKGQGEAFGLERVTDGIGQVLDRAPADTLLMLEGMPGAGNQVGHDPAHLGTWLEAFPADRVGVTLDTCHMFVAGLDLRPEAYDATIDQLESAFDLDRVNAWHLNDARYPFESNKDGHAPIGEGELGLEGFRRLMQDDRWEGRPSSLETGPDTYLADLKRLRELRDHER